MVLSGLLEVLSGLILIVIGYQWVLGVVVYRLVHFGRCWSWLGDHDPSLGPTWRW